MLLALRRIITKQFTTNFQDIKKGKWTKLSNRSLLIVQGPERLITNDLRQLGEKGKGEQKFTKAALYTLFLQPKGKILTDAFIFTPRIYKGGRPHYAKDEFWIDISKQSKAGLKQHLSKHLWRKNANLVDVQQQSNGQHIPTIYSGYNEDDHMDSYMGGFSVQLQEFDNGENDTYSNLIYCDPRGSQFGLRIVASQEDIQVQGHCQIIQQSQYNRIIQRLGMCPKSLFQNRLPFNFNFDCLNAISLRKGCYIGQQIISRGFLTGIIRKRIFPFTTQDKQFVLNDQNSSITLSEGQQVGKIMTFDNGQGLALINYINLIEKKTSWPIAFNQPFEGLLHSPFEAKLEKYIEQIKGKQKILEQLEV